MNDVALLFALPGGDEIFLFRSFVLHTRDLPRISDENNESKITRFSLSASRVT